MFERYVHQDRVWPSADGTDLPVEDLSPAHRLCVLLTLEQRYGPAFAVLPLVRRLRQLGAGAAS